MESGEYGFVLSNGPNKRCIVDTIVNGQPASMLPNGDGAYVEEGHLFTNETEVAIWYGYRFFGKKKQHVAFFANHAATRARHLLP